MTGSSYQIGRVWVLVTDGPLSTPCHVWQGCVNSKGYPSRTVNKRPMLGHRAAYEDRYGPTPAEWFQIHHRCENKRCVNADHLEAVTPLEHSRQHDPDPLIERVARIVAGGGVWSAGDVAARVTAEHDVVAVTMRRLWLSERLEKVAPGRYRARGAA